MDDTKQLIQQAINQGWRLRKKGRHLILLSPLGRGMVVIARTGSDWRGLQNTLRYLRRYGFRE